MSNHGHAIASDSAESNELLLKVQLGNQLPKVLKRNAPKITVVANCTYVAVLPIQCYLAVLNRGAVND